MSRFKDELDDATQADLAELERMEAERHRSTNEEMESQISKAVELLSNGVSRASAARSMQKTYGVSLRTAQRWVRAALLELCDAGLGETEMLYSLNYNLHRLEVISDQLINEGESKAAVSAIKSHSDILIKRLNTVAKFELKRREWLA